MRFDAAPRAAGRLGLASLVVSAALMVLAWFLVNYALFELGFLLSIVGAALLVLALFLRLVQGPRAPGRGSLH
jgi:hypothetical protein